MRCEECSMAEPRLSQGQVKAACLALDRIIGLMVTAECVLTPEDLAKIRERNLRKMADARLEVETAEEIESRFSKMKRSWRE